MILVAVVLMLVTINDLRYAPTIQPAQTPVNQSSRELNELRFILITGFEPFGGHTTNSSWEAVKHLNGKYFDNLVVLVVHLPVVWDEANEQLIELIKRYEPIAVIGFGQSSSGPVRLESIAHNARGNILDNEGMTPRSLQIYEDAPVSLETSLQLDRIRDRLHEAGVPVKISHDAGRYLCNDIFYTIMYHQYLFNNEDILGGFIHLPPLNSIVLNEKGNTIIFDQRQLREIAEIVILATVQSTFDSQVQ